MSYGVKITFRGLCGFIPAVDDLSQGQNWVGAFFAQSGNQRLGDSLRPLSIHHPYLRYRTSDLLDPASSGFPQKDHILDLRNLDVAFFPQSSIHANVSINYFNGPLPPKPSNEIEGEYFNWVPEMAAIESGAGVVNPQCLLVDPGSDIVTTRCHLLSGVLKSSSLGKFEGNEIVSQFHPPTGPGQVVQALANEVSLDIYGVVGTFTISLAEFGTTDIKNLVFSQLPDGGTLKLEVGNLCAEELFSEPSRSAYPTPDFDFAWHYRLSNIFARSFPPTLPTLPVPKDITFGGGGGGDFARCTQSRFAAPSAGQVSTMVQLATAMKPTGSLARR